MNHDPFYDFIFWQNTKRSWARNPARQTRIWNLPNLPYIQGVAQILRQ